jgi:hypothetical protein
MSAIDIISSLVILSSVHIAICYNVSRGINRKSSIDKNTKIIWYVLVWFIPVLGAVIANLYFKIAKISSGTSVNPP